MKKQKQIAASFLLCLLFSISVLAGDTPISGITDSQSYLAYLASGFTNFATFLVYLAGL